MMNRTADLSTVFVTHSQISCQSAPVQQSTAPQPVAQPAEASVVNVQPPAHDCGNEDLRIVRLQEECERLKLILENVRSANMKLKEAVSARCSSPSQKRLMLSQLEDKHGISRRNACRLLGLARSTCWYKSEARRSMAIKKYFPRTPISISERFRLLQQVSADLKAGKTFDAATAVFCEASLKQLGLNTASAFARTNLKLAMEMFEVYLLQQRQSGI